jgi:hypothetical protein
MGFLHLFTEEIDHFIQSDFLLLLIENGQGLSVQNDSSGLQVGIILQEIGDKQVDQYGLIQLEVGSQLFQKNNYQCIQNTKLSS